MLKFYITLLLLLPLSAVAQFTITGKVLDREDKKPVANASVFLSNATNGTASAGNGSFALFNVKAGRYTLVVSVVGYGLFSENILVSNNVKLDDISLSKDNRQLKEVVIKSGNEDPYRQSYITMFKQQFLGKTPLAEECQLLNPQVLDLNFDESQKKLTVTSSVFLEIENDALGYKIKYLLQDFVYINSPDSNLLRYKGNVLFEPLKGTPSQQKKWANMRLEVYGNSAMHFYRTLLSGLIKENGFNVQEYAHFNNPDRPSDSLIKVKLTYFKKHDERDSIKFWKKFIDMPKTLKQLFPYSLTQEEIANVTTTPGIYALGCEDNGLFITYEQHGNFPNFKLDHIDNMHNTECTLISFNQLFVLFDRNGSVVDPYSLSYQGVWANERVAQQLPVDYDGNESVQVPVDSMVANKVTSGLQDYESSHLREKTYLHFDKPYYVAGDTMYFKAYVTVGPKHLLSRLSGVLHADLISNNKVYRSLNLGIDNGVAWGDFVLPDTLTAGTFRVRAYTQWMRNAAEPAYFDKLIPVAEPVAKSTVANSSAALTAATKPDVQFLPEGGTMVAGIRSKVAFKAIGSNGLGLAIKGDVLDNQNKSITSFSSSHLGMGYFYLNPEAGKTYKAKITYSNGATDLFDLPLANATGMTLSADNDSAELLSVKINTSNAFLKLNRGKDYTLTIYSGGEIVNNVFALDSVVTEAGISKSELRTGIAKITLFSPAGEPLADRNVFIQKHDELKMTVVTDKTIYAPREKVHVKLTALNTDNEPVSGEFSASVTDETKEPVDNQNESTIFNNLLLTSDLKGYVEQPNYYFLPSADAAKNLDLLMLTQGYSGFEWKTVLNAQSAAPAFLPENSLSLSGNVKTLTGKPLANGKVTLLCTNPYIVKDTTTDKDGNFTFTGMNFLDTAKLVISAVKKNNSSYVKISIDKPGYPAVIKVSSIDSTANILTPEMVTAMQQQMKQREGTMRTGIMLKQVTIKQKGSGSPFGPHLTHSANLNGIGMADQVITADQLPGCTSLALCLSEVLRGVRFAGNPSAPTIYSLKTPIALTGSTRPMAIIVDGVTQDQSILTSLTVSDIYSIEVLTSPYYLTVYGSAASGGAIVITTKHGNDYTAADLAQPGSVNYMFDGYYKARTFYSPKYEAAAPAKQPDTRTTIYWEPQLVTDKDGNMTLDFYNSDAPGTYSVVVEGLDVNGNLGRQVYHYTVK